MSKYIKYLLIFVCLLKVNAQSVNISSPVYSGTTLNDATSTGSVYVGVPENHTFTTALCATGTPDTLKFKLDDKDYSACVAITGISQHVNYLAGNVSAGSWTSNRTTYTVTAHGLTTGTSVTITGASPSGYNISNATILVLTPNTFSVTNAVNPGSYTSGGVATGYNGVNITFAATTGHTLADTWNISSTANGSINASSFIQQGRGAVSRNVQDVLRDLPADVKGFGAKCDGVTDDAIAIQKAINASPNGAVRGSGDCVIKSGLYIAQDSVDLGGTTMGTTSIPPYSSNAHASIRLIAGGSTPFRMLTVLGFFANIHDILIDCNGIATNGIVTANALGTKLDRVTVRGCKATTIATTTATQATIASNTITVASATNIEPGQWVRAAGSPSPLTRSTMVVSVVGSVVTISRPTVGVLSATSVTFEHPTDGDGMLHGNQETPTTFLTSTITAGAVNPTFTVDNANIVLPLSGLTFVGGARCPYIFLDWGTSSAEAFGFTRIGANTLQLSGTLTYTHTLTTSTAQCKGNNDREIITDSASYNNDGWGLDMLWSDDNNGFHIFNFNGESNGRGDRILSGSVNIVLGGNSQGNAGPAVQLGDLLGGPPGYHPKGGSRYTFANYVVTPLDMENGTTEFNTVYSVCDGAHSHVEFLAADRLTFNNGRIATATIASGGSGWTTGDIATVDLAGAYSGTFVVTASGGVVTGLTLHDPGYGYIVTTNLATEGSGTGLVVNITAVSNGLFCPGQAFGNATVGTGSDTPGSGVPQYTIKTGLGQISFQPGASAPTVFSNLFVDGPTVMQGGINTVYDTGTVAGTVVITLLNGASAPVNPSGVLSDNLELNIRLDGTHLTGLPSGTGDTIVLNGYTYGLYDGCRLGTFILSTSYGYQTWLHVRFSVAGGYFIVPESCAPVFDNITISGGINIGIDSGSSPGHPVVALLNGAGAVVNPSGVVEDGLELAIRLDGGAMAACPSPCSSPRTVTLNGFTYNIFDGCVIGASVLTRGFSILAWLPIKFSNAGGYFTVPSSCPTVTSFNGQVGAVTLSSGDVTTALGYTPVQSVNTRTGVVTITSGDVTGALGYVPATKSTATGSTTTGIGVSTNCTSTAVPPGGGTPTITCTSVVSDPGHTHNQN